MCVCMYIFNHEQLHFLKCLHSFTPGTAAKTRGAVLDSRTQPDFLRLSLSRIQDDSSLCMPLKAAYSVQHNSTVSCIVWPYGIQRAPEFWRSWAWSSEDLDADSNAGRRRLLRTRSTLRYCWQHYANTSSPSMSWFGKTLWIVNHSKPICDVPKIA